MPWTLRGEQQGLRWVAVDDVELLPLHPGFAATWRQVRRIVETGDGP